MRNEPQVACSLNREELADRLAEMRAVCRNALVAIGPSGTLRFRGGHATRERLEAIIAAESRCCPFLTFDLRERGELLELSISRANP
jgi:MerR family transcriptional regulator, copper efflux regulator